MKRFYVKGSISVKDGDTSLLSGRRGFVMIKLENGGCIIGFDDGYQLGKSANFVFDNGGQMDWKALF